MCEGKLHGQVAVQYLEAIQWVKRVVQPVVQVHDEQVVSGCEDPAKAGLPGENLRDRVVLEIVGELNPGIELGVGSDTIETREKAPLRKVDAIPLAGQSHHHPFTRTKGQGDRRFLTIAREKISQLHPQST